MAELPAILEQVAVAQSGASRLPYTPQRGAGLCQLTEQAAIEAAFWIARAPADATLDPETQGLLEAQLERLASLYRVALSLDEAGAHAPPLSALRLGLIHLCRSCEAGLAPDPGAARALHAEATEALGEARRLLPMAEAAGALLELRRALSPVYDPASGRSRYDPKADASVSWPLPCPRPECGQSSGFLIEAQRPTQSLVCPSCQLSFTVHFGVVVAVASQPGHSEVNHQLQLRQIDGGLQHLTFREATPPPGLPAAPGDLIVSLYDLDNHLRLVINHSRQRAARTAHASRCFVVTAALGPHAPELWVLRRFRDERLRQRPGGRALIAAYEAIGPHLARLISGQPLLRRLARALSRAAAQALAPTLSPQRAAPEGKKTGHTSLGER